MINTCYTGFYNGIFPDKRLDKRMEIIVSDLVHSGSAIVNKAVAGNTRKIAWYRTLRNTRFDHNDILSGSYRRCADAIDVDHVLCIQDTTEFNLDHISSKVGKEDPDIGPTGNNNVAGLFCHPVMVCDPTGEHIYGLASASLYNRKWDKKDKYERQYHKLPIEQKESYRWIEHAELARSRISEEVMLTVIGDRESDIYEEFTRVGCRNTHVLVRARADRRLQSSTDKLYGHLQDQPIAGSTQVELPGNQSRTKRTATIEIRHTPVEIAAPESYKGTQKSVALYAIEAKEVTSGLPKDQHPIHWRLLTTHRVEHLEHAQQCIDWYKQRWGIEELFRVLKTKGFRLEDTQLGNGASIKKLIALTLEAALVTMRLKRALDRKQHAPAGILFSKKELLLLTLLLKNVEGKTLKQQNPHLKDTMAWAAWIIARLGKWSGYASQGPPGYITMKNGFDSFNIKYELFEQMYEPEKDVYRD